MPTPGLSLVGFLDLPDALQHMRAAYVLQDTSDAALTAMWNQARQALGPAFAGAGNPEILPMPAAALGHVGALTQQPWVQPALQQGALLGANFVLVEVDPLLAFQFTVDTARSGHHNGGAVTAPSMDELLQVCLPHQQATEQIQILQAPGSMMLTSRSLNLRMLQQGFLNGAFLGMHVGLALPFVQVVRHNGRCYLHNGFHRAVGLRGRGATHIPCVLRDVPDHESVGIRPPGTFGAQVVESANPPTVGHFTQARALPVTLKAFHRTLHISWAEYASTHD
jgi:hypothetical protein